MLNNEELAKQMRENCVKNEDGIIMVSPELWELITKRIENSVLLPSDEETLKADVVDIKTIKAWLYKMAINNVGCVLEGDFSKACEEIASRLDGLRMFAKDTIMRRNN